MKKTLFSPTLLVALVMLMRFIPLQAQNNMLWYRAPADEWMKSLPIGNGRVGAMIFGGVEEERIALEESSLWSGEEDSLQEQPFGYARLQALRHLFFEGDLRGGNEECSRSLTGTPHSFGTHLPMGDMLIRFLYPSSASAQPSQYRRELNLANAVCSTTFKKGEITYHREYIASNPRDALIFHFTADRKGALSMDICLHLLREAVVESSQGHITFKGQALFPAQGRGGVNFMGEVSVETEKGVVDCTDDTLHVRNANSVTIITDVRTNYHNPTYETMCHQTVERVTGMKYEALKREHIKDYAPLFARVSLTLGPSHLLDTTPTDSCWLALKRGESNPALVALFVQYARYLLLASSRENSPLPAALQGIFNDNLACNMCWTSDYHLDINTQQNYWMANVGNLAQCNLPLFGYIAQLARYGAVTAQKVYGCRGWTAHTTANIWGFTAPSPGIGWGLFPTAGSWIATHLWTQYEYTLDKEYLATVAYPLLKENARFLLDYLTPDPRSGYWVTGPSISPENSFGCDGGEFSASMMPTCDRVLVHEIFTDCIKASALLGIDRSFADSLLKARAQLPPLRVNQYGGLAEWLYDYEDIHPNHRHTSHLLSFYPFAQITLDKTPSLCHAVEKTLERRMTAPDWEDTEWSRANAICYYARLKNDSAAAQSVHMLLTGFTRENLLSISPKGIAGAPCDIFIFDGNSAGAAGIAEMLVQSHQGYVEWLPCLPREWGEGSYSGLCVRGGAEVSARWRGGVIEEASLTATACNLFSIKMPRGGYLVRLNGAKVKALPNAQGVVTLYMNKGDKFLIEKR